MPPTTSKFFHPTRALLLLVAIVTGSTGHSTAFLRTAAARERMEARLAAGIHAGRTSAGRYGGTPTTAPPPSPSHADGLPVFNVLDYGAKPNTTADNTKAFQDAIDAASAASGGIVYAPVGGYEFEGSIVVSEAVVLRGSYLYVPSHDCRNGDLPTDGTVLKPRGGRLNASATPFITVQRDGALRGVVIFHPDQAAKGIPVPYPYAVSLVGNNAAVTDVELLNPWNGISAVQAHRHYIARVQGQPLNIGVFVDETYDIGRIEDVHFNPWYSDDSEFISWQVTHGRAFVLGRSDWEYVFNTFAFAYAYGYHFIETPTGSMNGNFLGIGADYACNASVQVDAAQAAGILISNGEFTSFHDKTFAPNSTARSAQIVTGPNNSGPVQISNTAFWGPTSNVARLLGHGTTTFSSCVFVQWDLQKKDGSAAIEVQGGSLVVQGTEFQMKGTQLLLSKAAKKVVFLGNIVTGPEKITDQGAQNLQKGLNAFD